MNKKDLLENIRDYSPKEIAKAIQEGVVSFYELKTGTRGQFTPLLQRQVKLILESGSEQDNVDTGMSQPDPIVVAQSESDLKSDTGIQQPQYPPYSHVQQSSQPQPVQEPFSPAEPQSINMYNEQEQDIVQQDAFTPVPIAPTPVPATQQSRLVSCPECGHQVSRYANECPSCGMPFGNNNFSYNAVSDYRSTQPYVANPQPPHGVSNANFGTPPNLNKFSWGGFVLNWIWGIFNGVYWSLLVFIPIVNLVIIIMLGINGRRYAWESKQFDSIEHFERVQKGWDTAGLIIFILNFVVFFFYIILAVIVLGL